MNTKDSLGDRMKENYENRNYCRHCGARMDEEDGE